MKAADDPLIAALRDSGAGVVTLVAKSHDRHVELALRTTLEENLAMVQDTVVAPAGRGAAGVPRRGALLRRLPRQPRLRPRGAADRVRCRRRGGRAVRHQRRHAARLGGRRGATTWSRRPACASASTATTTPAAPSRTRCPRSTPAPRTCRARSTGTASAPATPTSSAWSPTSSSSSAGRCCRTGSCARRPGSPTPSPTSPTSRPRRASRTSASRRSRTRPGCTPARSRSTRTSTSTWTPRASATTCGCSSPTWPGAPRSSSRVASSASTSTPTWSSG